MNTPDESQTAELIRVADFADQLINQVLPQARHIVLDIYVANELCMALRRLRKEGVIE